MSQSFTRFGVGLLLSVVLVYLILMAQFRSFIDPFIILTAIPPGLAGALVFLLDDRHTTLNIMSLMGVIMMTGIVVSNSILIVEFSGILHDQRNGPEASGGGSVQGALASHFDDLARDLAGLVAHGLGDRGGQRTIRAAGPRHDRRTRCVCGLDRISGAGDISGDSRSQTSGGGRGRELQAHQCRRASPPKHMFGSRRERLLMPKFALAYPFFIIMVCLVVAVVGVTTVGRMPVDLFPQINIPWWWLRRSTRACLRNKSRRISPTPSNASLLLAATSTTSSHAL